MIPQQSGSPYMAPFMELTLTQGPTDGLVGHRNRVENVWRDCTDCEEKRSTPRTNGGGKNSQVLLRY